MLNDHRPNQVIVSITKLRQSSLHNTNRICAAGAIHRTISSVFIAHFCLHSFCIPFFCILSKFLSQLTAAQSISHSLKIIMKPSAKSQLNLDLYVINYWAVHAPLFTKYSTEKGHSIIHVPYILPPLYAQVPRRFHFTLQLIPLTTGL